MAQYRKKPVVIEAFQYGIDHEESWFIDRINSGDISCFSGTDLRSPDEYYCEIKTLEGTVRGDCFDFIIQGVSGETYPCKPDIFEKTYEKV